MIRLFGFAGVALAGLLALATAASAEEARAQEPAKRLPEVAKSEFVTATTLYTQGINTHNSVHGLWTPVQHYRGKTFLVVPDGDLRPMVTQINDATGETITVPLDPNPNYRAFADGHNRFTMGIDPDGFLHIAGDMHGYGEFVSSTYVERYQHQNMMYWRSNKALNVTGGFTFAGGAKSTSRLPGVEWGGDSRFFNDQNGVLYFSSRVRAFMGSKLAGSEPFIAYGLYRYDHTTGVWTAIGDTVESAVPDAYNFNKVFYWEHTIAFEAFQTLPRFDSQNRLHFCISGNSADAPGAGQIYAVSDDQGRTWKKATGEIIPGLPLRGKDGERNQGQLIIRATGDMPQSGIKIDKDGRIATRVKGRWSTWNGKTKTWVPFEGGKGILGPDGMLTGEDGGPGIERSTGIGQPVKGYPLELNFNSFSELGLRTTNALYGVGLARGTGADSAKQMWVNKISFGPAENVVRKGTATASSSKDLAALAFDGKESTQWTTATAAPGWLGYAFAARVGKTVCRYDLTSAVDLPQCDPMDWEFQVSADGAKWVTLDARKNQLFPKRNQTKSYLVNNPADYPYYRLNVLATRGGAANGIQLAELKLLAVDTSAVPGDPKIFFAQNDNGKVWLSWTQPDRGVTYTVKRGTTAQGPFTVMAEALVDPADFSDSTGIMRTPYYYVVSAANPAGQGPDSEPVQVTAQPASPRPPLIMTAEGRNQRIALNWLSLWPQGVSYTVKRSATPGGPYEIVAKGVPGLTYTDIGLVNDKPYYYVVSALNANGVESPDSREIKGDPFRWIRLLHYKSKDGNDKGSASASKDNPPHEPAAAAFDGERSKWLFVASTAWLQYKFPDGTAPAVTRYQMISAFDYVERDPKDWELQGSTDGTNWVTLDIQKNQNFDEQKRVARHCPRLEDIPNRGPDAPNVYSFPNTKGYQYYRLNIAKTRGGGLGSLGELVLWADDVALQTPPPLTPFPIAEPVTPASGSSAHALGSE